MRYEIRHLSLRSTLKFGLIAGALLGTLPGLCLGVLLTQIINRAYQFLSGVQNVNINLPPLDAGLVSIPLPSFTIDVINALGLQNVIETLASWNAAGTLIFVLVFLTSILGTGLLLALPMLVFSLIYNAIAPAAGGFKIDLINK